MRKLKPTLETTPQTGHRHASGCLLLSKSHGFSFAFALCFVFYILPFIRLPYISAAHATAHATVYALCLVSAPYAFASADTTSLRPKIHLAYAHEPGCPHCQRAEYMLKHLQRKYPQLVVQKYDITVPEDAQVVEALAELYQLPSDQRLLAPTFFIGDSVLVEEDVKERAVRALIQKYEVSGTEPPWELCKVDSASQSIVERFESFGPFAVAAAGLLDGINPCAFTTIIFFISYMALAGRKGRDIILVGVCFTSAVFVTYLLIGVGALSFIQSLSFVPVLSVVVYSLAAFVALVFGVLSLYDFFKFRAGRGNESILQLPKVLKQRIHKVIRTEMRSSSIIISTLIAGFLVSILELACTGQVYLPTILFVTRMEGLGSQAFSYLLLYNMMFVVPLIAIFLAAYGGTSSQKISHLVGQHLGAVKLLTSLLFFGLGAALLTSLLL